MLQGLSRLGVLDIVTLVVTVTGWGVDTIYISIYLWLDHCFSQSTSRFLEANVEPQKYICRVVQVVGHLSYEDHEDHGWNSCIAWNDWRLTNCLELLMEEIMHHLTCMKPYKYIMGYLPYQLVQDFCHLWALRDSQSVFWSRFSRVYTQEI